MECGAALTACPKSNSKRKAAEAALDEEGLSGGEDAAPAEFDQQEEAPPRPKQIMSQEWIDSVLADRIKPLPFNERMLQDPRLAAILRSHEESRGWFVEYQNWIRRELETKGYVEIDDDYEERCELLQAVHSAAFYGRKDEEEAMAKLAALRRRPR